MTVTPESLAAVAGFLLSLAFFYIPGLNTWYNALGNQENGSEKKSAVMGVAILACAVGAFALNCFSVVNFGLVCTPQGVFELLVCIVYALAANQGTYTITRKLVHKKVVPEVPVTV